MILVDSSVWIDYFNGANNPYTAKLDLLLGVELIAIGDIILTEILQVFQNDKDFSTAKAVLLSLTIFDMLGLQNAIVAAENFRFLRKQGITIRKTIDCMIATFCIQNGHQLLFCDKDFQPFVEYLSLGVVDV
ncbi:PIN domain nuclease [Methyloglobulus sp.]|uniref:type II toxin-antitoxin system VapC family toxin n=1 Tax=Methyloglobulus sp. TaxID=2518622 RepID=UPI0032B732A7